MPKTDRIYVAGHRGMVGSACIRALDAAGFDIRMHVHDEVIVNEPKGGRSLEDVIAIMRRTPDWIPGLPLNAAGFTADFYMKD